MSVRKDKKKKKGGGGRGGCGTYKKNELRKSYIYCFFFSFFKFFFLFFVVVCLFVVVVCLFVSHDLVKMLRHIF